MSSLQLNSNKKIVSVLEEFGYMILNEVKNTAQNFLYLRSSSTGTSTVPLPWGVCPMLGYPCVQAEPGCVLLRFAKRYAKVSLLPNKQFRFLNCTLITTLKS